MKECNTFLKKINNCLNHKLKPNSDLSEHLKTCKECSDFYNSYLNATASFRETMNGEISKINEFDFNFINKEENNKKTITDFRKIFLRTALIAASVIIIITASFLSINYFSGKGNYIALNISNDSISSFFDESYNDSSSSSELNVYDIEWFNSSDIPEMNFDELFF